MKIDETSFQANIVRLAHQTGWLVHHDRGDYRDCIAGDPGFPDLVLAREGRLIFAELKDATRELSQAQVDWLKALAGNRPRSLLDGLTVKTEHFGADIGRGTAHLWRPGDIEEVAHRLSRAR